MCLRTHAHIEEGTRTWSNLCPSARYDFGAGYALPPTGDHSSYVEAVQEYGLTTHPSIFGFHENATLTKDQNEAYADFVLGRAAMQALNGTPANLSTACAGTSVIRISA